MIYIFRKANSVLGNVLTKEKLDIVEQIKSGVILLNGNTEFIAALSDNSEKSEVVIK